ncbi:hypothetical protein [Streptomyces sp. NPDC018584]|uniref:hypothetical protein n=1 Tax=unclassified Streptomyces TaxID=2593676 RepID=UPI0037A26607
MSEQIPPDWNLILFRVAALSSIAVSVGSLVWGLPWLAAVSVVCFTAQLIGWRRHARQRGGGA